ncbi:MAG: hypothetical protein H6Q73_293 [Firmicutes bacterium]|nr:hypothetical protein [Bacillota bacterium]
MRAAIIGYLINALASAFIGVLVCLSSIVMDSYQPEMLVYILHSAFIGVIIGTVCRFTGHMFGYYFRFNLYRGLGLTFIIIALGIAMVSDIFGVSLLRFGILLAITETLGLVTAYFNIKYAVKLNERLRKKQADLSQKQNC